MKVRLNWNEELQFIGRAGKGPGVIMDSSESASGATPMEMVLMGVAGCTGIDVVLILQKKRLDLQRFEILVDAEQSKEWPKRFTKIHLEYLIYGEGINPPAVEQAIKLSTDKYCSAMASLNAEFSHSYRIFNKP